MKFPPYLLERYARGDAYERNTKKPCPPDIGRHLIQMADAILAQSNAWSSRTIQAFAALTQAWFADMAPSAAQAPVTLSPKFDNLARFRQSHPQRIVAASQVPGAPCDC